MTVKKSNMQIILNLLSADVNLRGFSNSILNYKEELGDNLDDVTRLEHKVTFLAG